MMKKMISWVEIPAVNMESAVKFYNAVLGIELKVLEFGEEQMACFPGDEGAISLAPGFKPSKDGVLVSLNMEERMDEALLLVVKEGGSVVKPKTRIEAEGRGYFALVIDNQGNKLGFYSSK